jgi:uncharacterized protein YceK
MEGVVKVILTTVCALLLSGCGAEVATTAATGAAVKKQQTDAAQQTKEMAQKKIDQAAQAIQKRGEQQGNADK